MSGSFGLPKSVGGSEFPLGYGEDTGKDKTDSSKGVSSPTTDFMSEAFGSNISSPNVSSRLSRQENGSTRLSERKSTVITDAPPTGAIARIQRIIETALNKMKAVVRPTHRGVSNGMQGHSVLRMFNLVPSTEVMSFAGMVMMPVNAFFKAVDLLGSVRRDKRLQRAQHGTRFDHGLSQVQTLKAYLNMRSVVAFPHRKKVVSEKSEKINTSENRAILEEAGPLDRHMNTIQGMKILATHKINYEKRFFSFRKNSNAITFTVATALSATILGLKITALVGVAAISASGMLGFSIGALAVAGVALATGMFYLYKTKPKTFMEALKFTSTRETLAQLIKYAVMAGTYAPKKLAELRLEKAQTAQYYKPNASIVTFTNKQYDNLSDVLKAKLEFNSKKKKWQLREGQALSENDKKELTGLNTILVSDKLKAAQKKVDNWKSKVNYWDGKAKKLHKQLQNANLMDFSRYIRKIEHSVSGLIRNKDKKKYDANFINNKVIEGLADDIAELVISKRVVEEALKEKELTKEEAVYNQSFQEISEEAFTFMKNYLGIDDEKLSAAEREEMKKEIVLQLTSFSEMREDETNTFIKAHWKEMQKNWLGTADIFVKAANEFEKMKERDWLNLQMNMQLDLHKIEKIQTKYEKTCSNIRNDKKLSPEQVDEKLKKEKLKCQRGIKRAVENQAGLFYGLSKRDLREKDIDKLKNKRTHMPYIQRLFNIF